MCGIVGAIAERNVVEILLEGLKRLEYRGYDSAGVAVPVVPVKSKNLQMLCTLTHQKAISA
jgi:glucosamine 6-phosphate synthetase-like amidotransferase/phosphosugar isomerase protein